MRYQLCVRACASAAPGLRAAGPLTAVVTDLGRDQTERDVLRHTCMHDGGSAGEPCRPIRRTSALACTHRQL